MTQTADTEYDPPMYASPEEELNDYRRHLSELDTYELVDYVACCHEGRTALEIELAKRLYDIL